MAGSLGSVSGDCNLLSFNPVIKHLVALRALVESHGFHKVSKSVARKRRRRIGTPLLPADP